MDLIGQMKSRNSQDMIGVCLRVFCVIGFLPPVLHQTPIFSRMRFGLRCPNAAGQATRSPNRRTASVIFSRLLKALSRK